MSARQIIVLVVAASAVAACSAIIGTRDLTLVLDDGGADASGSEGETGAGPDAADARAKDSGTSDAGTSDAGTSDSSTSDAGTSDSGTSDAGTSDAGTSDSGTSDSGTSDSAARDSGSPDAAGDAGCTADVTRDGRNCGRCGHDCQGGSCTAGLCQPVTLALVQGQPEGIAVDALHVYWAAVSSETVMRANKDGTGVVALASGNDAGVATATGVAVDNSTLYWVNDQNTNDLIPGQVVSCSPAACKSTTRVLATGLNDPRSIAVDDAGVYWAETFGANVGRVSKAGSGAGSLVGYVGDQGRVASDGTYVYFVNYSGTVGRVSNTAPVAPDGGAYATISASASAFSPGGIAVDGTRVYWTALADPGLVQGAPKAGLTGGTPPTTYAATDHNPNGIVSDGANIYWASNGPNSGTGGADVFTDGTISTCPVAGCPAAGPIVLARKQLWPRGIAFDGVAVYWTNYGTFGNGQGGASPTGSVMKVAKP